MTSFGDTCIHLSLNCYQNLITSESDYALLEGDILLAGYAMGLLSCIVVVALLYALRIVLRDDA